MGWKDVLFPRMCVGCESWGAYICAACVNRFQLIYEPICPMCARPSTYGHTHARCLKPLSMHGLVAAFEYRGVLARILGKFKYALVKDMADTLVEVMVSMADMQALEAKEWSVVPVPLHSRRERWRGFNQAEVLASRLSAYGSWDLVDAALVRTRYTTSQMTLSRAKRLENLRGAFGKGAEAPKIVGRHVLLVDDVWTTGSTMRECTKVLKRVGAASVWGLVWAR